MQWKLILCHFHIPTKFLIQSLVHRHSVTLTTLYMCNDRDIKTAAVLSGTLRTYQSASCVDKPMTITCPPGTTIAVSLAQYGGTGSNGTGKCSSSDPSMLTGDRQLNNTCIWPQSLQVCVKKASLIDHFRGLRGLFLIPGKSSFLPSSV